jgi:hypothetical protein
MKPEITNYEILYWAENFGYMRKVINAQDVFAAITILRKGFENKYGNPDGKLLIVKVEQK